MKNYFKLMVVTCCILQFQIGQAQTLESVEIIPENPVDSYSFNQVLIRLMVDIPQIFVENVFHEVTVEGTVISIDLHFEHFYGDSINTLIQHDIVVDNLNLGTYSVFCETFYEGSFVDVISTEFTVLEFEPGCTDPDAINYDPDATINWNSCLYEPPELFQFDQLYYSSYYGDYSFQNILIEGIQLEEGDWIAAFHDDLCVGVKRLHSSVGLYSFWTTDECSTGLQSSSIKVYGNDGSPESNGFMESGNTPSFKIYDSSENIYYDAIPSENFPFHEPEQNSEYYSIRLLLAVSDSNDCNEGDFLDVNGDCCSTEEMDCTGLCNGEAFMGDCGCVGGTTGMWDEYCFGCMEGESCNYNPDAIIWDDCCIFPDCAGECGGERVTDDQNNCCLESDKDCTSTCWGTAIENECGCVGGSTGLETDWCYGCTDPEASNYNPDATIDDGSCEYLQIFTQTIIVNPFLNNFVSFYVLPTDLDLMVIFQPLIESGYLESITCDDESIYFDGVEWVNEIGDMSVLKGYSIVLWGSQSFEFQVSGQLVVFPVYIPLFAGENLIGYPVDTAQPINDVMEPLADEGVIMMVSNDLGEYYVPDLGVGSLTHLEPGSAYSVTMYADAELEICHPIAGCNEVIYGCMDPTASNYDPEANIDDGSCEYEICPENICVEWYEGEPFTEDDAVPIDQDSWVFELNQDTIRIQQSLNYDSLGTVYEILLIDQGENNLPEFISISRNDWGTNPPFGNLFVMDSGLVEIQDWDFGNLHSGLITAHYYPAGIDTIIFWSDYEDPDDECYSDDDCPEYYSCVPTIGDCDLIWGGSCFYAGGDVDYPCYSGSWLDAPPACGCDGTTYLNWCEAALMSFEQVAYIGACLEENECYSDDNCPLNSTCIPSIGECDFSEVPGDCVETDLDCPMDWIPVCGCDGITYTNECWARSIYGVAVDHVGFCGQTKFIIAENGSDETGDGSIENPFGSIQLGIDQTTDGDTVLVLPGTYYEYLDFDGHNIIVGSLLLTTGDTSYISSTIIDGNNTQRVIRFSSDEDSTAVLSGFTIQNGFSNHHGGGIYCYSNPTISNVIIKNNFATNYGGGIYCNNSNMSLDNIAIINNNSANYGGGGLYCSNSNLSLTNFNFNGNSATGTGGALRAMNSDLSLTNVMISGNSADRGAGIYSNNSNINFTNVTITGNSSSGDGGGIYYFNDSSSNFTNCILWNNLPEEIYFNDYSDPMSITIGYSDIQGGEVAIVINDNGEVFWLDGNIDSDPLFVNPENGDYHLQSDSPCIDAGDPSSPLDPDGTIADMGAFYHHHVIEDDPTHFNYILNGQLGDYLNFADTTGLGVFTTLTIEDSEPGVDIGDEIGLLDHSGIINFDDCSDQYGEILVGAGVWNGEPLEITTYGSMDFCEQTENDYGQYPGWVEGNTIIVLLWRAAEDREYFAEYNGETGELIWQPIDQNIPLLAQGLPVLPDLNDDGNLDVIDIVLLVDYILGNNEFTPEQIEIADLNNDGSVDILDIVEMVELILDLE